MTAFIDEPRGRFGIEPICRVLDVSACAYYRRATGRRSQRVIGDARLAEQIRELHAANYYAYGYRKMWLALQRHSEPVGGDRVKRLMRTHGIQGQAAPQAVELIDDRVWRTRTQLELAIVEWVAWFNTDRLHESLGDIPPAEFETLGSSSTVHLSPSNSRVGTDQPGLRGAQPASVFARAQSGWTTARRA